MRKLLLLVAASAVASVVFISGCAGGSSSALNPQPSGCGGGIFTLVFQQIFPGSADLSSYNAEAVSGVLNSGGLLVVANICPPPVNRIRTVRIELRGDIVQGRSYLVGTGDNLMTYTEEFREGDMGTAIWNGSGQVNISDIANDGRVTLSFDATFNPRQDIPNDPATGSFRLNGTGIVLNAFMPR
jgi:hypothetical protein